MTGESLRVAVETIYTRVTGDPVRYAPATLKLLERARAEGDAETLVIALRARAWALHGGLNNAAAKRLLDEAVRIAHAQSLPHRLGEVLVTRAIALQELGRFPQARQDLHRAGHLLTGPQRADLLLQRAVLDHNTGRAKTAAALYRQVLAEPGCAPVTWIKAANNLSNALTQLGRPAQALSQLERAAELAHEQGASWLVAVIAGSRAWTTFHAGRVVESLRLFEQAGPLYQAADAPIGEHYLEYADALVDLRLLDEAARVARLAADDLAQHDAPLMAAEALLRCSRLALALGDVDTARKDADAAITDLRRQRRTAWVARATVAAVEAEAVAAGPSLPGLYRLSRAAHTLHRLGLPAVAVEAHLAAGRTALALDRPSLSQRHLTCAAELAQGQSVLVRLRGRLALALLAESAGDPAAVLLHCRAGLQDLTRHRSALPSVELRVFASGHGVELGALALRAVLPTASAARVFTWLERTRGVSMLFAEPVPDAVNEDLAALRSLEQQLRTARREQADEPAELVARQAVLEARIRRHSWARHGSAAASDSGQASDSGRASAAAGAVIALTDLRRLLAGDWLVEFAAVDGELLAVVVGPQRTRLIRLGAVAMVGEQARALLFGLRGVLRGGKFAQHARQAADQALTALAEALIAPLGIPAGAPLVVVPCAPLLPVLWSGLHDGPLSAASSATVWARSRETALVRHPEARRSDAVVPEVLPGAALPGAVLAAVAGPGLPGAEREVTALGVQDLGSLVLLPQDATVDATVAALSGADLAHLACHGRLRSDNPLFSALELADGSLTLYELLERGVAPHRLVLAVCDSAVERGYDGDEVLGFVSALMAQGTAGVIASGIEVPDGAAVQLMTTLHRHLAGGLTLAQALYRARADGDRDDPGTFVAWCGLTAYGAG